MKWGDSFESMKRYLKYIEENADRPWLRPINNSEGLMISVGNGARGVVEVGGELKCMVVLSGGEEVVCGCGNGELVVVNMKENVVMKRWVAHELKPGGRSLLRRFLRRKTWLSLLLQVNLDKAHWGRYGIEKRGVY